MPTTLFCTVVVLLCLLLYTGGVLPNIHGSLLPKKSKAKADE